MFDPFHHFIPFFRTSTQISIVFPIFDGSCCILWDLRSASLRWWFALYQSWYQTWQVGKWTVEWMGMNGDEWGMYLLSKNVKYSKMFINFDRFPEWNLFFFNIPVQATRIFENIPPGIIQRAAEAVWSGDATRKVLWAWTLAMNRACSRT